MTFCNSEESQRSSQGTPQAPRQLDSNVASQCTKQVKKAPVGHKAVELVFDEHQTLFGRICFPTNPPDSGLGRTLKVPSSSCGSSTIYVNCS